jgi:serine phosphatase RsbU (regulator of sigma subunit)/PAS domain-containing protein
LGFAAGEHGGDVSDPGEPLRQAPVRGFPDIPASQGAGRTSDEDVRRALLDLAITAAGIGTFDWDLVEEVLTWDDQLVELFGYDTATFDRTIEAFNARIHPDDLARTSADLRAAITSGGEFASEYRIVLPGSVVRWVGARGRALCDEAGNPVRVLGAAWDVSAHREADARVARVLESMATAFFSVDLAWQFTYVNAQAERLLGRPREEILGGVLWDLFPAAVGTEFETHYRRAMETGQPVAFDAYYPPPLDAWFQVNAWRSAEGLAVYFLDVTARRQLLEQSQRAAERTALLGRITEELVATLDLDEAAERLASLVVPTLADWCIVTLVDDDRRAGTRRGLHNATARHRDPAMQPLAEEYAAARLAALTDDAVIRRAMKTGRPQFLHFGASAEVQAMVRPGRVRDLVAALAPEAVAIMPLIGREGPVGMLTLCNGRARGAFTDEDVTTATHVSARAGLVLDNARLYRQQRDLAEGLQRSLLTAPPEPNHSQVVVRYTPASQAAQVGGDWYDAFIQPGGATVLVIGDVVGHDTQAAAAMSQVRSIVRTVGVADHDSPAEVLRKADTIMQRLQVGTTATAVVARLEQTDSERSRGVTHLRWSNAGHPPPMVINPDGTVLPLLSLSTDLLLGIFPETQRREAEVTLDRNAVVFLYTDGLVERRDQSLDAGLELLQATLEDLAGSDLDTLCDAVLARMLPEHPEDDVALVAVRLHGQ